jgi:hypothetical protein
MNNMIMEMTTRVVNGFRRIRRMQRFKVPFKANPLGEPFGLAAKVC